MWIPQNRSHCLRAVGAQHLCSRPGCRWAFFAKLKWICRLTSPPQKVTNLTSPSCCCLERCSPLFDQKIPSCYSSRSDSHVTSEQRLLPWHLNSFPHHWVDPMSPDSHLMRSHSSLLWFISQVPKSRALNLLPTNCAYVGGQVRGGHGAPRTDF